MKDNKVAQALKTWTSRLRTKKEEKNAVCHVPEETRSDALISVRNLYKKFGKLEVLNGINLDVEKGDIFGTFHIIVPPRNRPICSF